MSTVKQLKAELTALNVDFPKKANKAALSELLATAQAAQPQRKQRVSTKQIIRDLFPSVGDTHSVEDVVAHVTSLASVQPATIVTMIGDLKNPKYAAGDTINIVRKDADYVREA